jgi:hypothetical protein
MKPVTRAIKLFSLILVSFYQMYSGNIYAGTQSPFLYTEQTADLTNPSTINNPPDVGSVITDTSSITAYKSLAARERLKQQAAAIKAYAMDNIYNMEFCFLIDMSIPSGKRRFFIYNIKKDSIEYASLVSHGFGSEKNNNENELIFSNNPYSFKTSLGKYKIGSSYQGNYGLAYKLFGLDSTNSKAFERAIVLHADHHVPDNETYPGKIFQSAGCPTVTPVFLNKLSGYIKSSKKPILLWIYS